MRVQQDEIKESTSEVDDTLFILERLSLSTGKMRSNKAVKDHSPSRSSPSRSDKDERTKSEGHSICYRRYIRLRFRPYAIPLFLRCNRTSRISEEGADRYAVDSLNAIRLAGCDFKAFTFPLFPPMPSGKTTAKPCWLQHEQTVEYASNNSHPPKSGGTATQTAAVSAPSSSDSELNFEIDELSEYFQHFVNVRLKMSFQAESMYV